MQVTYVTIDAAVDGWKKMLEDYALARIDVRVTNLRWIDELKWLENLAAHTHMRLNFDSTRRITLSEGK